MSKKSYISPSMQILCFENLFLLQKQLHVTSVVSDDVGYKEDEFEEEDEDLWHFNKWNSRGFDGNVEDR